MSRGGRRQKKLARAQVQRFENGHGDAKEMPPTALRGWMKAGKNYEQTFEGWEVHAHKPPGDAIEVVVLGKLAYETLVNRRPPEGEQDETEDERAGP